MAVHFSKDRLEQVLENHEKWWNGTLNRPLVKVTLGNAYPAVPFQAPPLTQSSCKAFEWSAEEVIDTMDAVLSTEEYLGDSFPMVNFDAFGPGSLAAFCGAKLDNSSGNVWFFPQEELPLEEIHVRYDPENVYVRRIKALYRAGLQKWEGSVVLGLPDLGGVMDVAATFRGSENLLMDLYDAPEEVLRLVREIEIAWYDAMEDFCSVLAPQKCFTHWSGLLSREPSYIVQCDFAYMIGNPMFRSFVLDSLRADTQKLSHTIYHLDGIGQLNHLDDVLSLEDLNAVQWVYGDGQPTAEHWLDVYRRIQAAGKQTMIVGPPESYLKVLSEIHGTPYTTQWMDARNRDLAEQIIAAR